jgi:hypothetical protein
MKWIPVSLVRVAVVPVHRASVLHCSALIASWIGKLIQPWRTILQHSRTTKISIECTIRSTDVQNTHGATSSIVIAGCARQLHILNMVQGSGDSAC